MLTLRGYQERSLEALKAYLGQVNEHGAQTAFVLATGRPYLTAPNLPGLPYVCLRVPTGGGKTLMAAHSIGLAARTFLQADHPLCLWLVPSNAIREQTLAALRDRSHPYRQAIDAQCGGHVRVMDLTEALYVQRGPLDGETSIIVATLAAFRVEDKDGRKVYEEAGALQHHFTGLEPAQLDGLERRENGAPICSLANVLRLRRPLVLIDEAHNARTPLSFETLTRFAPSCILEFTATPETTHQPAKGRFASNVLHHVSAAELKAEEMIKLPIRLTTQEDWKQVIGAAVQTRNDLEDQAKAEEAETGEYIRPIVLFQAQAKHKDRETLEVETVRRCLVEDFRIPEEQIAVATGDVRGIEDKDLFDRACPIRHIVTVQALKEGWDCSFAYVLCSVVNTTSARAAEQLMGRVLRMPNARRKRNDALNSAYAFVASREFAQTAQALTDALVENGFERFEAESLIVPKEQSSFYDPGSLFHKARQPVRHAPDLSALDSELRDRVSYDAGAGALEVSGVLTYEQAERLKGCFNEEDDREAVGLLFHKSQSHAVTASVKEGRPTLAVPLLATRVDGRLEQFEESHYLDAPWNLADHDPGLSEAEFTIAPAGGQAVQLDIGEAGKVQVQFIERLHEDLSLLGVEPGWTIPALANWLDRGIPHPDIPQPHSSLFIHNALDGLMADRGLSLDQLASQKFRLRGAIERKIDQHRKAQTKAAYQGMLFGDGAAALEVSPELCLTFEEYRYAPNWYYEGGYRFAKHLFPLVGELKAEGEEYRCAVFLDSMPEVEVWVRNLERRPEHSFWLQTSTDRFYPDFVAKLTDGRILVVESKGEDRWSNDDSKEKRALGALWADRSYGQCAFVMPKGPDWDAIKVAIVTD